MSQINPFPTLKSCFFTTFSSQLRYSNDHPHVSSPKPCRQYSFPRTCYIPRQSHHPSNVLKSPYREAPPWLCTSHGSARTCSLLGSISNHHRPKAGSFSPKSRNICILPFVAHNTEWRVERWEPTIGHHQVHARTRCRYILRQNVIAARQNVLCWQQEYWHYWLLVWGAVQFGREILTFLKKFISSFPWFKHEPLPFSTHSSTLTLETVRFSETSKLHVNSNFFLRSTISGSLANYEILSLLAVRRMKTNWIGHTLHRNCVIKCVIEGKIDETKRGGTRRKQLPDDGKANSRWILLLGYYAE